MNRTGVSLAMSAIIHLMLFMTAAFLIAGEKPAAPPVIMRVALNKTVRAEPVSVQSVQSAQPVQPQAPYAPPAAVKPPEATPKPIVKQEVKPAVKPDKPRKQTRPPATKPVVQKQPEPVTQEAETLPGAAESAPASSAANAVPSSRASGSPGSAESGVQGIVDASALTVTKKVNPDYPMISRKRREQGTVVLLIGIESGRVKSAEVERGSGHAPLDESAKRAVREWVFDISGYGDKVTARIPFKFELK
jgi:protein TonB